MIEEKLFLKGIASFNKKQFYDAHEHWEEIWSEITIPDDLFFQGLIQMSVAYFHITNHNLKGAKSLFTKSINKLEQYTPFHRGLDIQLILLKIKKSLDILNKNSSTDNFIWDIVPILKIND
tara:strand:+ start:137 stop:499 length:363 start_codon:yes stop_codon:yes gene_type:complete